MKDSRPIETNVKHYYHVYSGGIAWKPAVDDHLDALERSGLYEALGEVVYIGFVGNPEQTQEAKDYIGERINFVSVAEVAEGWEQETQDKMYEDALGCPDDTAFLYAHTKGASTDSRINNCWRDDMTAHTVERWQEALDYLEQGYNLVGIFWSGEPHNYMAGTFFWATAGLLKTLGYPERSSRWGAEGWTRVSGQFKHIILPGSPAWPSIKPRRFGQPPGTAYLAMGNVVGPNGKLVAGRTYDLVDSAYLQMLVNAGHVVKVS